MTNRNATKSIDLCTTYAWRQIINFGGIEFSSHRPLFVGCNSFGARSIAADIDVIGLFVGSHRMLQ